MVTSQSMGIKYLEIATHISYHVFGLAGTSHMTIQGSALAWSRPSD
jgi:hypothetical protein